MPVIERPTRPKSEALSILRLVGRSPFSCSVLIRMIMCDRPGRLAVSNPGYAFLGEVIARLTSGSRQWCCAVRIQAAGLRARQWMRPPIR
ncbi:hypothetical protein QPR87_00195 [Paracoccus sp. SSJ]|nr:hypothetical protein [Paracoccus sp. SSJ]